jgi:predicted transcriptional regulator
MEGQIMHGLGSLEAAVMEVLWAAEAPLTVRNVRERLVTGRPLAYTTVMTILDNLHRKHFADRVQEGRGYKYWPVMSREQAVADAVRQVLAEAGNPEAALLHFASTATDQESKLLRSGLNRRRRSE